MKVKITDIHGGTTLFPNVTTLEHTDNEIKLFMSKTCMFTSNTYFVWTIEVEL
jgi:hypothetical protein